MAITSKALFAATLLVSLGAVSTTALAGEVTLNQKGQRTITVPYSDLNIGSAAGQAALAARLRGATKTVCGDSYARVSLRESSSIRTCVKVTTDNALASASIGSPIRLALQAH
jgi:UrcA family protein